MSAYVIGSFNITNPDEFGPYTPAAIQAIMGHGGEILAAGPASEVLEGEPRQINLVLRFADNEAVHGWYDSQDYRSIIHIRQDNSEGSLFVLDGFAPPA